jgi:hypothetical protein
MARSRLQAYYCPVCFRQYRYDGALVTHIAHHHPIHHARRRARTHSASRQPNRVHDAQRAVPVAPNHNPPRGDLATHRTDDLTMPDAPAPDARYLDE